MTSMMKLAAAAALTLALGATAFAEDTIKFGVAAEPYKPFTVKGADGNWSGWEVDLRDAVCREIKVKCEWVETAWEGIIPALLAKKFDVIWSSMTITEERAKTISFTDKYYKTGTAILASKDAKLTADAAGLAGKVLGAQVSTTQLDYANKYFKGVVKELKTYQTQDEVNQDLAAGRIDAQIVELDPRPGLRQLGRWQGLLHLRRRREGRPGTARPWPRRRSAQRGQRPAREDQRRDQEDPRFR